MRDNGFTKNGFQIGITMNEFVLFSISEAMNIDISKHPTSEIVNRTDIRTKYLGKRFIYN